MITKTVLLTCLLQLIVYSTSQSVDSCTPDYFQYVQDEITGETIGQIEIRQVPQGVTLQLSVALDISASAKLPDKYVGRIKLAQSKQQSVKAIQQGRPLKYNIYFPLRQPIPTLTGLWLNDQLICTDSRASKQNVTNIVLKHTLYPPGVVPLTINETPAHQSVPFQTTVAIPVATGKPIVKPTTQQPEVKPTTRQPEVKPTTRQPEVKPTTQQLRPQQPSEEQINLDCGRSNKPHIVNQLIAKGTKIDPGQWPWLAAIHIAKKKFELHCAGMLVSHIHVLTAAHCFQTATETLLPGSFLVSLGRHNISKWKESGSAMREMIAYELHPDYRAPDPKSGGSADSDLAVLILRERVEFSVTIKPICLWSGSTSLNAVVGMPGIVVGWGRDESGKTLPTPQMITTHIVSRLQCLVSNKEFVPITSNRTFCAGSRDGSGPCNGDSGSGFVMYDRNSDRYYLRGLVSLSLGHTITHSCDLTQYVVYVDVAKYQDWIRQTVKALTDKFSANK